MLSVCGIDPGLDGALAILGDDNSLICYTMPTFEVPKSSGKGVRRSIDEMALVHLLRHRVRLRHAFIEQVGAAPMQRSPDGTPRQQGTASMFNFGEGFGIVKGITAALEVPRTFFTPSVWKRYYRLTKGDKEAARLRASEVYPHYSAQWEMVRGQINREQAGGRAEAALIALFGRLSLEGKI